MKNYAVAHAEKVAKIIKLFYEVAEEFEGAKVEILNERYEMSRTYAITLPKIAGAVVGFSFSDYHFVHAIDKICNKCYRPYNLNGIIYAQGWTSSWHDIAEKLDLAKTLTSCSRTTIKMMKTLMVEFIKDFIAKDAKEIQQTCLFACEAEVYFD